ncbi:MAG: MBL fold metallo-hydrolase [Solirubrobacteraceae bacterium]|nr:MBL fold metallo-hydrolase [Patulibacter sp.]
MTRRAPVDWSVDPSLAGAREVMPGLWRLRLPLNWPGIDHTNAYAVDAEGGGIVLFDCGAAGADGDDTHEAALDIALAAAGRRIEEVELLVGTHAHADHMGLAAHVVERSGCELWAHPQTEVLYDAFHDPDGIEARRRAFARREGVPEDYVPACADIREETDGVADAVEPDVALGEGSVIPTALGPWRALATPGHTPSHLCFLQEERRTMVVADLVCAAFAPWFDHGYSHDPYGEWQASLERIADLGGVDIGLPGHGRPAVDLPALLTEHRTGLAGRLDATRTALVEGPATAWEITCRLFGTPQDERAAVLQVDEAVAYLRHLQRSRLAVRAVTEGGFRYAAT